MAVCGYDELDRTSKGQNQLYQDHVALQDCVVQHFFG